MVRKLISITLCALMLLCMGVPALAAANDTGPTEARTVDDILNEYHEKSFALETAESDTGPAARSNRSGSSGKSLEEETVEELTTAGYEAYHVTSSNYGELEASLHTDLGDMGLDPEGSYIIVLTGENHSDQNNPNSRSAPPPDESIGDDSGGAASYFRYQYNGDFYYLRYITITSGSNLIQTGHKDIRPAYWYEHPFLDVLDTLLVAGVDAVAQMPLGTILSLILGSAVDDSYTAVENNVLTVMTNSVWTVSCIQVWDDQLEVWDTAQCSSYAISQAYCTGFLYNEDTHSANRYDGVTHSCRIDSPNFYNYVYRQDTAVSYHLISRTSYDYTGNINFYLTDTLGNIIYTSSDQPFITHIEAWTINPY